MSSDSLLRILLGAPSIQRHILDRLVDALMRISSSEPEDEKDERFNVCSQQVMTSDQLCVCILNHIKWCESITEPRELVLSLQEIVASQALPRWLQLEIVSALPAMSPDRYHEELAMQLLHIADSVPGERLMSVCRSVDRSVGRRQ